MNIKSLLTIATVLALSVISVVQAQELLQFGNWGVGLSSISPYAQTSTSGGTLVVYDVDQRTYTWVIENTGVICQDNSEFLVHVRTDTGTNTMKKVLCATGGARFIFKDFEGVNRMLQTSETFQVDIPQKGAPYYSVTFSMNGIATATEVLEELRTPTPSVPPEGYCQQQWNSYNRCKEDFRRCTVRTGGSGPCPSCFIPNCSF